MNEDEKQKLVVLANAYKEQVYEKLLALLPQRLARIDIDEHQDLPLNDVLGPMYMQGVGEALDAFSMEELLRALTEEEAELALEA